MVATLCSAMDVILKIGSGVSSSGANQTNIEYWIQQAEGYIRARTRYDWVANFASLSTKAKDICRLIASNLAAIWAIQFNMSGYTTRIEAETMIDILYDQVEKSLNELEKDEVRTFLGVSS